MKFFDHLIAVLILILGGGLNSAQAAEVKRCWLLEPMAEPIPFQLPNQICIDDAAVHWRDDYPSHVVLISGTPISGAFELDELGDGETTDSILVQATLKTQVQNEPNCHMKRGAFIRFRFEVSINTKTVYNSKLWIDYFEADQNCSTTHGLKTIAYLPIE